MGKRIFCLIAAMFLFLSLNLSPVHAENEEKGSVSVSLTSPQTTYAATDSIPVSLTVVNNCGLPISDVILQILPVDGYAFSKDSAPDLTQPVLFHGQKTSTSAVHELQAALPLTGDNAPTSIYLLLAIISMGGFVWLSMKHTAGRRVMSIVLCVACLGTTLLPGTIAQADGAFSLDPSDWPAKIKTVSRSVAENSKQTVEVTQDVTVGKKTVTLRARVTYTLPGALDNLDDGYVDLGDLEMLESQGKIDVLYDTDGQAAFIIGPFSDEKVTNCQEAADVLNSAASLFGYDFWAEPEDIEPQQFTDIYGTTERFFRYSPVMDGVKVLGSQIVLAASEDGSIVSLTNSYNNKLCYVDTEPELTQAEAETKAKEAFLLEPSVQAVMSQMKKQVSTATDADVQAAVLAMMQTETELLIYAANDEQNAALVYAVTITNAPVEGEEIEGTEDVVVLPHYILTYYVHANGNDAGEVRSVINEIKNLSDTTITAKDNRGFNHVINVTQNNQEYSLINNPEHIAITRAKIFDISIPFNNLVLVAMPSNIEREVVTSDGPEFANERKAVSLHANMAYVYRYYKTVLNRNSYDDEGAWIECIMDYVFDAQGVGFGKSKGAGWMSQGKKGKDGGVFVFGSYGSPHDCIDAIAHEFTHAVTDYTNRLINCDAQSGALNEAYSDIMGNLVEGKTDSGIWTIGESDPYTLCRDMSDPSRYGQAEHYSEYDWKKGKYYNAGIPSFAAYKMMTDSRTRSVTSEQWARIFYKSMPGLSDDASFLEMRGAVLTAARAYGYRKGSDVYTAIEDAFDAVGVGSAKPIRIVLNWGSEPEDLDAHLIGPGDGELFHVYYGAQGYYANGVYFDPNGETFDPDEKYPSGDLVADLDYDDVTSWGPEIITIHTLIPGDYYFFVHDFTTGEDSESRVLANSGATVKLTLPNGQVLNYKVNPSSKGTIWEVFRIRVYSDTQIAVDKLDVYGDEPTCCEPVYWD